MKYLLKLLLIGVLSSIFMASSCEDDLVVMPPMIEVTPPAINANTTISEGPYHPGCPISLTATAIANATFEWVSSDGSTYSGDVISLTFDSPGNYDVTLTASLQGRSEEVTRSIVIVAQETFSETFQQYDGLETNLLEMVPHPDGSFVSVGNYCYTEDEHGNCAIFGFIIVWFDANGKIRTKRSFSNSSGYDFRARAVAIAQDGNVLVAYERKAVASSLPLSTCLAKIGEVGDFHWTSNLETPWNARPRSLLQMSNGKIVIGGNAWRSSDNMSRSGMYFFSANGDHIENIGFGELNVRSGAITHLIEKSPGEVVGLMSYDGRSKLVNANTSTITDLQVDIHLNVGLLKLPGNEILAIVSTRLGDDKLIHLNTTNQIISNRIIEVNLAYLADAQLLADGNIMIAGFQIREGVQSGYVAEITPQAAVVWEKRQPFAWSRFQSVRHTNDCGLFAVGLTNRRTNDNSGYEAYYIKMKPKGEL